MREEPGRETLERTGPSPGPETSRRPAAAAPALEPRRTPVVPAPRRTHQERPRTGTPRVPRVVPGFPNVCALGKKYGGWPRNSPESTLCERAYGH
ncbi:hypothetical protein ACFWN1_10135 [Streptomyces sp. NPDC058459]|uniref:hypothetical protein n=1 Tax=Streptomyces sp. NPDC058459 TaxID=3346508 RepID=UPI003646BCBA